MIRVDSIKEIKNMSAWAEQILFWRTHLDVFIEEQFDIKQKDVQKVIARAFGNFQDQKLVKSRGFGKTWLVAVCCLAMGVLYPGSLIAVASGTAEQATLVLRKINDYFVRYPNIMREIRPGRDPVTLNKSKGVCYLKNGSKIESFSVGTLRGNRAKIVVIDEAPEVKQDDLDAVISPIKNTKRDICHRLGIPDYPSKMISITSACLKSNYFYSMFVHNLKEMARGNNTSFACALDYRSAVRVELTNLEYFMDEKSRMPQSKFDMEYGSIFIGEEANSVFPYAITEPCRTLKSVELSMPRNSKSEYVIAIDLATSSRKTADNAVIVVLKQIPKDDGSIVKKMVYMRTFHGRRLDYLAEEVRRTYVRFPNTIKIIFDQRGLGDAFPQFLNEPWTDPASGKEYPAWICDNEGSLQINALPILRSVKATQQINQAMASALRVSLEQKTLLMPVNSRNIVLNRVIEDIDGVAVGIDAEADGGSGTEAEMSLFEKAVFAEADALQIEMGNIVGKTSPGGNYLFETAKSTQRKDRCSALSMGVHYVYEMEEIMKKKNRRRSSGICVGYVGPVAGRDRW